MRTMEKKRETHTTFVRGYTFCFFFSFPCPKVRDLFALASSLFRALLHTSIRLSALRARWVKSFGSFRLLKLNRAHVVIDMINYLKIHAI